MNSEKFFTAVKRIESIAARIGSIVATIAALAHIVEDVPATPTSARKVTFGGLLGQQATPQEAVAEQIANLHLELGDAHAQLTAAHADAHEAAKAMVDELATKDDTIAEQAALLDKATAPATTNEPAAAPAEQPTTT